MNQVIENYFNKKDVVYCKVSSKGDFYEIPLCISEVLKSNKFCAFKLVGIPPNKNSHEGFVVYCTIDHFINAATPDVEPNAFWPQLVLNVNVSKFDPEKKNFANHLAKYLKLPIGNIPFRNCRIDIDSKKSENFSPVTVFEKPVNIHVCDQNQKFLYNFILDWPSRIAIFKIPKKSISTFITYYFSDQKIHDDPVTIPEAGNIIETIRANGFDKHGDPAIDIYDNGTVEIMFEYMPPYENNGKTSTLELFNTFEKKLEEVLKTKVIRDDREHFIVLNASKETALILKDYLENFWINQKAEKPGFLSRFFKKKLNV